MAQYIDKDALVAEIEKLEKKNNESENVYDSLDTEYTLKSIRSFIDTLEAKEVDLDTEYIEEVYSHLDSIKDTTDRMTSGNFMHNKAAIKFSANVIAKVLELIGLKAMKGE